MSEISEGSEIRIPFVVTRLAKEGEKIGDTAIMSNAFRNLWWAVPVGKAGPEILICTDGLCDGDAGPGTKLELPAQ